MASKIEAINTDFEKFWLPDIELYDPTTYPLEKVLLVGIGFAEILRAGC